jgi:hypothetical protein
MTEDEAKTKWCPAIRFHGVPSDDSLSNRSEASDRCITSACMAWQPTDNEGAPSAPGEPNQPPKPAGYCGLTRGRQ